jgi:hypothetical protein
VNAGLLVAIIVIVVIVLVLVWVLVRQQRTARLRKQFGPEYERAVNEAGSRQAAEAELEDRRARHEKFEIVALEPAAREHYLEQWRLVQAQFVDSPTEATRAADRLINEVMRERGYPVEDFEQRAADISVDHPQVVDDYRAAHTVAEANERSEASTEDLRQALVHYRSLFEDLLETHGAAAIGLHHETAATRDEPATTGTVAANGDAALASEPVAADREPVAAESEPVAADREPVAADREPVAADREPVAADREPVAAESEPVAADRDGLPADREPVAADRDGDEIAPDEGGREHEGGSTDVRPPAASTPPEQRTTEEAR